LILLRSLASAALCLSLVWAGATRGADLRVTPVRVDLGRDAKTALITLRNGGSEEARYQVSVLHWEQTAAGQMKLGPTEDIVFFPKLFGLKPGEQRNLRVGTVTPFGTVEKTYRLFVEELPPPEKPDAKPQVRVLTRIGVPVFLAPLQPSERGEVADLAVRAGKASFRVVNKGTMHIRPLGVRLSGTDRDGNHVLGRGLDAWYVLAGGERDYEVELPKEACPRVAKLTVEAVLGEKERITAELAVAPGACGP
jgi:fimbrial chaperone protein